MDFTKWFGNKVVRTARRDPAAARRLLLAGYRANELSLKLPFTGESPRARRYAAESVTNTVINALANPEDAALVSLFTPCELLVAAGATPYSLETVSGYLMGTKCEADFQQTSAENGVPETMCSFHRTFLGAAQNGLLPRPRFIVYTNLACDGNMVTFPYLTKKFDVPHFFIDVPYGKSDSAVRDVAEQLMEMKYFIEAETGRKISDSSVSAAVKHSRLSCEYYMRAMKEAGVKRLPGSLTDEMYAAFMSHILLGSSISEKYFACLADEYASAPISRAKRLVWLHAIPFMQPALRSSLNCGGAFITSCELCYDAMLIPQDENEPYLSMARRLVYSAYNGGSSNRVKNALTMARLTKADGAVIFAHWGCKTTLGAVQLIKNALEKEGLPSLILDGDACSPANTGDGQISTRVGAFLEMLEAV